MTWIQTYTGRAFDLLHPDPEDVSLEDVAHALAHLGRFTGHARTLYTVAQHSVLGTRVLRAQDHPEDVQRAFLLHDAHEAYVGDVASPIKRAIRAIWWGSEETDPWHVDPWTSLEERVRLAVAARFRLPAEVPAVVRDMDLAMLHTEARDLLGPPPKPWCVPGGPVDGLRIRPVWDPSWAEREFLSECERLEIT